MPSSPSSRPLDSPATELSFFTSPSSDYANSLFSPPLTKSSQLSLNTTVLGAGASAVSYSKATTAASTGTMTTQAASPHAGSASGSRTRLPASSSSGGGGPMRRGVGVFSPTLEEDEDGVFSSAASSYPSSPGHNQPPPPLQQARSETPPLKFTPRRPSDGSVQAVPSAMQASPTKASSSSSAHPTPSRTQAMISQFEQRQTPRSSSLQQSSTPTRTPFSKSQLDKPLPPISPMDDDRPYPRPMPQHPPLPSSSFLPAPPSPSTYAYAQSSSPTHRHGGGSDGPKRSPLRDGIKSLVKKFSASTSPSKFRRGHKASASSGSEMSISRPTHIGGVSWDLRAPPAGAEDGTGEEVLGSDADAQKSDLWAYPRTSRMDGEGIDSDVDEPYEISDAGAPAAEPQGAFVASLRAARPLPAFPTPAPALQPALAAQTQQARQSSLSFAPTTSTDHSQPPILRHGPLLLFSSTSSPPHWIRTTATLSPSHLSFAFASLRGSLEHVDYGLPGDSIVRSVPEREASGRWPAPFGNDDEDDDVEVHYLEIALAGQGSVAVAVRNVGERLGWVGSIWDAILASVMSPDPSGAQILASFPAAPVTSPFPPPASLPVEAGQTGRLGQQDSPQESILSTPPLSPAHQAQGDAAGITSCAVTTDEDDSGRSTDDAHIRRSGESDRSSGPPQLTLSPSKPLALNLLRRGSGQDDGKSDHSLRFSVEQMFRGADFSSYAPPASPPPPPLPAPQAKRASNVAALASAYENNSVGSHGGGRGSWSKASSGVGRAERGEGPTSLDHFEDHTRAARIRSQAHHRHSKSNPPPSSPPARVTAAGGGQPYYFSTRPGTSPSAVAMGRSRSDSLPQTQPVMFSPGGRSEYYVQDFDESDLNPSRSASQIQRRVPPPAAVTAVGSGSGAALQAAVQEQYEDVQTPRQSLLFETANSQGATTPADVGTATVTPPPTTATSADLTAVIQLLSAQAASSSTRGELADLKLTSVQDHIGALVLRSTVGDGKLDVMLHSLKGVEEGMKEVALGVVGTTDERTTLQATVDEVNEKLSVVLSLCERFGGAVPTARSSPSLSTVGKSPSTSDLDGTDGSATPRRLPPPVAPIIGLPGGASGRLPDDAFELAADAPKSTVSLATTEQTPVTNAATEDATHGASISELAADSPATSSPSNVDEVLRLIRAEHAARGSQDQQTTDIARYLNELNSWMEEFVRNGHSSVDALSDRVAHLQDLIQPPPAATPRLGETPASPPQAGVVGQIAALRDLVMEVRDQQAQAGAGGPQEATQQRLEQLLASVEMERQRYQQQNSSIEAVVGQLDRQRTENQHLLKAMVHDLKSEIQGERIRFIDAMRDATQINIEQHLQKFKDQLSHEVARSLHDLHRMREEKKVLEGQIAELFAFKVKNGDVIKVPAGSSARPSFSVTGASTPFPSPSVPLPPLPQQPYQQ